MTDHVHYSLRALADQKDPAAWRAAREGRIGASDAASFAKEESIEKYVAAKMMPAYEGSMYTQHGHIREPEILAQIGATQNTIMFGMDGNDRFSATPDGIDGNKLTQVKTTLKTFKTIPLNYRRQVWWEQMVMGPQFEVSDFVWETYTLVNGRPVPEWDIHTVQIERDEAQISKMVSIALQVLKALDSVSTF